MVCGGGFGFADALLFLMFVRVVLGRFVVGCFVLGFSGLGWLGWVWCLVCWFGLGLGVLFWWI